MIYYKYSLCTAYQSTVQTEQAMNRTGFVGLGRQIRQQIWNFTSVGQ